MKKTSKNKKGFTLIELIVVVAILLALMLMLVPKLSGFVDEAKMTANTANARAVYTAIQATETAKGTGMYTSAEPTIKVCEYDVYTRFWDSKAPTETCTYDATKDVVTYGSGSTKGIFPSNATPTATPGA